ncbi:MAG TPA: GEVED domain-containing protein, partial [Kiritimatiellia bacterium]|nr:GEVED domain-containing protein [Kiritimatiellia bacterium]
MKYLMLSLGLSVLILVLGPAAALAGPSLPVTKPPVADATILTGPPRDAPAVTGQWFRSSSSGIETVRTHEFYDELLGGGSGSAAIAGYVSSITYDPAFNIIAFSIVATINNDTSQTEFPWSGNNSHGESLILPGILSYVGPMYDTKLTAEFAVTDLGNLPLIWNSPYRDRPPYIIADNEDQAAWYCWNPDYTNQERNPAGGFYVPTWDFGDIPQGQFSTQQMDFSVQLPGISPLDTRYPVLQQSFSNQLDVLANRTTSLKVSTWIDEIALDVGQNPEPPLRSSDVSVFHNAEETPDEQLDFGDAPDPSYPTSLATNGARHVIVPGIQMGLLIDAELDGQPNATATGDDNSNLDDEDGVTFLGSFIIGQSTDVVVQCSVAGTLAVWVDFNTNGSWGDFGENVLGGVAVTQGLNYATINVPASASPGPTYARFRFTTLAVSMNPYGLVNDGEVEDYQVTLQEPLEEGLDYGDAWDGGGVGVGYPTRFIQNGARHAFIPGVYLGARIDTELDGQPTINADGDDLNPPAGLDDEDGVVLPAVFVAGATATVTVVASVPGYLNAWIDWNSNMSWLNPGEQVFVNQPLSAGINLLPVNVPLPPALVPGGPHSRWRFTTHAPVAPAFTGAETNGEVEDYEVRLEALDFGDTRAPYPTLLANDGARHRVPSAYWLGAISPDMDPDGMPSGGADGDDLSNLDDEDGMVPSGAFVMGRTNRILVTASTNGYLDAWMDFNWDRDWADAGDQICASYALAQGVNIVTVAVPAAIGVGQMGARLRFSSMGGLSSTGLASDGEVEDYWITIYQPGPTTNIVVTNLIRSGVTARILWT